MNENSLLKIALICSIVGVFIVLVFAEKLEPPLVRIIEISEDFMDQDVMIQGEVVSVKITPSTSIFDVKDESGSVKVVTFDKGYDIGKGQAVEVTGTVKEYKGVLEIEAKRVVFIY